MLHQPALQMSSPVAPAISRARLHGLDAIRGAAMLAGVLLHAAVPYMPTRYGDVLWPVQETATSSVCDWIFWGLHAFRLPMFFFLSGFLAEQLYMARGERKFVEHRCRRLLVPYLTSLFTILPLTLTVWLLGWFVTGRCELASASPFSLLLDSTLESNVFNPGHLWFLLDLLILNAGFVILRKEWQANDYSQPGWQFWRAGTPAVTVILAFVPAMLLWSDHAPYTRFTNSFLPDAGRIVYFGAFFTLGLAAYRRQAQFAEVVRPVGRLLGAAAVFTSAAVWLMTASQLDLTTLWSRGLLAWSVSFSAWCFILGMMGLALHGCRTERPAWKYLADSSYWIYLVHLPLVGFVQIALRETALSPLAKMSLTFVIATTVGLGSYQVGVRYTLIGEFLHGTRRRDLPSGDTTTPGVGVDIIPGRCAA